MQAQPTTGHVYATGVPGIFGIVSYFPDTVVSMAAFKDEPSMTQVCERLGKRLAGKFVVADRDTAAWGKVVFEKQGSAVLI